jgi:hypothetical protein
MTFEQALEQKQTIGNSIKRGEVTMTVLVSPFDPKDLNNFANDFRVFPLTDQSAKEYSTDGKFTVCGFWTDGAEILFKELIS